MPRPLSVTSYTVKAGDTLAKIARQFGVTVDSIVRANGLPDPNQIRTGVVLGIPKDVSTLEEFTPSVSRLPVTLDAATGEPVPEVVITGTRPVLMQTPSLLDEWLRPPKVYLGLAVLIATVILLSTSRDHYYD